jgi:TolB-like protein
MSIRFGPFELDEKTFELRKAGARIAVEPQVLSLLLTLVHNRDRLVTTDEIIRSVWNGRVISDAAVASRIKSARHVLDDDGRQQRMIRTIHSKGFRFVHPVEDDSLRPQTHEVIGPDASEPPARTGQSGCPSIAVLPFRLLCDPGPYAFMAEALPLELLSELARLRWLFVIARGSSFRLAGPCPDLRQIGVMLGVKYCLTGTVEETRNQVTVAVELADTRTLGIIWSERYATEPGGIHDVRSRIVSSTLAALEVRIPFHEAQAARLKDPKHLDTWSAYHLGVQHMYRFTEQDNRAAIALFEHAVATDPTFSRAHGGLSFAHFQNAFLNYVSDHASEAIAAHRFAALAVELDPFDPFANLTMGRAHWLTRDVPSSLAWLDRAIELSPNYAQGRYARAWSQTILGRGQEGQSDADHAMLLSPIDPLHYAMLATRALSHLVRGDEAAAAQWADRAACSPGAHMLILAIAAACHALNGDVPRGRSWANAIRCRGATLSQSHFFRSFPFKEPPICQRISHGLRLAGI